MFMNVSMFYGIIFYIKILTIYIKLINLRCKTIRRRTVINNSYRIKNEVRLSSTAKDVIGKAVSIRSSVVKNTTNYIKTFYAQSKESVEMYGSTLQIYGPTDSASDNSNNMIASLLATYMKY